MTQDVLMALLVRFGITLWVGLLLFGYSLHPAFGAVILFGGWLALGASWNWLSEKWLNEDRPARPVRHRRLIEPR
ncbi:MAG TPA: hypothetical protein VMK05_09815 [Burkholderiales bacterium]|nr:hypothetical protein [Burkholderiales bacterium]